MRVDEAVAAALCDGGVTAVFALMSDEVSRLIVELDRRGVAIYTTRHEAAAVGMADGYSRISGSVGIAIVGRGPGLSNALTAIVCAAKSGSRVVVLAGDSAIGLNEPAVAAAARSQPKHVEQAGILEACGVTSTRLASPATASSDIGAIIASARAGSTVVVNLPTDLLRAEAGTAETTIELPLADPLPLDRQIAELADVLESSFAARRPLILAGHGAVMSGARSELIGLADRIGALLGTSLLARSLFAGEPYDIGVVGSFATPVAGDLLRQVDVVLAFGASLGPYTTFGGDLFGKALIVQIDRDAEALGRLHRVDLAIEGDATAVARALADELGRREFKGIGYRDGDIGERIAEFDRATSFTDQGRPGSLDPRTVMMAIDRCASEDRIVVIDPGHHLTWSATFLTSRDPDSFIFPGASGAIGSAPAIAYGAAVAAPDRLTVLDVGDGGMMMTLADLETAVRYRLPLLIVVSNDAAFGSEVQFMRTEGLPETHARYPDVGFAAVARAIGADGLTISDMSDLEALPGRLGDLTGPLVVDCKITTRVRGDWVDFRMRSTVAPAAGAGEADTKL